MNYIGKNIRFLRKENKLSQDKLGKLLNKSESTIQMWETGFRSPTMRSVQKLSEIFQVDINDLVKNDLQNAVDEEIYQKLKMDYIKIPLYSSICCGNGGFNDDNILEYIPVPSKGLVSDKKYFGQYAEGNSMKEAGIGDGDLLVFEKVSKIDSGVIGCFCVDENKAMCKKYKEQNGIIILQPMNNDYEPIIIDPLNNNFRCVGKLKKVIKDFEWDD